MKRFAIDTNFNYLGPDKPALSQKEVEILGLKENERVMVYQDEDEWKGIICFDDRLPFHYQWYVKLILDIAELLQFTLVEQKFDEAIRVIDEIGRKKDTSAIPILIRLLNETEHGGVRNAIAIALSDMRCEEAIEHIITLVKHPKTRRNRGTLLYALEGFDISNHILAIVPFLFDNGFEVSRQAFLLIQSSMDKISPDTAQSIMERVESVIRKLEEKLDFLEEAHSILRQE